MNIEIIGIDHIYIAREERRKRHDDWEHPE